MISCTNCSPVITILFHVAFMSTQFMKIQVLEDVMCVIRWMVLYFTLRDFTNHTPSNTVLHSGRPGSSRILLWEPQISQHNFCSTVGQNRQIMLVATSEILYVSLWSVTNAISNRSPHNWSNKINHSHTVLVRTNGLPLISNSTASGQNEQGTCVIMTVPWAIPLAAVIRSLWHFWKCDINHVLVSNQKK